MARHDKRDKTPPNPLPPASRARPCYCAALNAAAGPLGFGSHNRCEFCVAGILEKCNYLVSLNNSLAPDGTPPSAEETLATRDAAVQPGFS